MESRRQQSRTVGRSNDLEFTMLVHETEQTVAVVRKFLSGGSRVHVLTDGHWHSQELFSSLQTVFPHVQASILRGEIADTIAPHLTVAAADELCFHYLRGVVLEKWTEAAFFTGASAALVTRRRAGALEAMDPSKSPRYLIKGYDNDPKATTTLCKFLHNYDCIEHVTTLLTK